jgi:NAD(P)-dependent dehydrogenase (short-subunit alcohol dehydrogenase family)
MDLGLTDRVVLVTGGSSGIGRATAESFGREGARVAVAYHGNEDGARATARAVEDAGGSPMTVRLALEEPASIAAAVDEVVDRWDRIDVLVAGAVQWPTDRAEGGRAEALSLERWDEGLRVNLEGTIATVHAVLPSMRANGWGRIVLISSGVAEEGLPGPSPYGVAKAGLHGLARQLTWDVGRDGILVNVVAAGFTVTERNLEFFRDSVRDQVASNTPSRRLSAPADVASLITYLGSEANGNLTGEILREGSSTGRSGHRIEV